MILIVAWKRNIIDKGIECPIQYSLGCYKEKRRILEIRSFNEVIIENKEEKNLSDVHINRLIKEEKLVSIWNEKS